MTRFSTPDSRSAEVIRLLALGFTQDAVASRLGLKKRTVQLYKHWFLKMYCGSERGELTLAALGKGLVTVGELTAARVQ
jgi:DNA-binding NarL/FixJ family response regulator